MYLKKGPHKISNNKKYCYLIFGIIFALFSLLLSFLLLLQLSLLLLKLYKKQVKPIYKTSTKNEALYCSYLAFNKGITSVYFLNLALCSHTRCISKKAFVKKGINKNAQKRPAPVHIFDKIFLTPFFKAKISCFV